MEQLPQPPITRLNIQLPRPGRGPRCSKLRACESSCSRSVPGCPTGLMLASRIISAASEPRSASSCARSRWHDRGRDASTARAVADEGERMLAAIRADAFVVALDVTGKMFSTEQLSGWLRERMREGRDLTFLIGGPDGLAPDCLKRSDLRWSLSALTLPHALVRIVVAEQLYRAVSLLKGPSVSSGLTILPHALGAARRAPIAPCDISGSRPEDPVKSATRLSAARRRLSLPRGALADENPVRPLRRQVPQRTDKQIATCRLVFDLWKSGSRSSLK